jgi:membrane-bound metal-dependent hydrolase YbcI (DUF457 family)
MAESRMLLTATVALLVLAWGLHWPALTRRIPRPAWWLAGAGTLLPLLDPVASRLSLEDQIAALTRTPLFAGPLPSLGLIAALALAVGIWQGARPGAQALAALTAGLVLHLAPTALTPWGVPMLAPFSPARFGWPVLPQSHALAIPLLAGGAIAHELWPSRGRWLRWSALAGVTLYAAVAVGGFLWAAARVPPPADAIAPRSIEPAGIWPVAWLIIDRAPGSFAVTRVRLGEPEAGQPERIARWNDEPLFLSTLGDPVVYRLYARAFLHPVAELTTSGSQTTLTVQELAHQVAGSAGPRFVLESDLDGRNRLYRLERFD